MNKRDSGDGPERKEGQLLLVDDNEESLTSLDFAFSRSSYRVLAAHGGLEAIRRLDAEPVDVVVSDLKMPDVDGMEVLHHALSLANPPTVILLTAFGTIESAVEALRIGAFHYLTKPVNLKELRAQVDKAMEHQRLRRENESLRRQIDERFGFEGVVGETPRMIDLMKKTRLIADSRATVLILGESGTGKELIAHAIHNNGPRRNKPFIAVHCAAIPETLLESELFGHEKGAFTGAIERKAGRFEQAHGGTLFLDEVAEIPLSMQVKLLRVLETLEFRRVGGVNPIHVDVRVVAATNRDLSKMVAGGEFREDLFYRLNVVSLEMPPLRERLGDIPLLVRRMAEQISRENHRKAPKIEAEVLKRLAAHHWPGNIRELRNIVENMLVFSEGETISVDDLPSQLASREPVAVHVETHTIGQTLEEAESNLIKETLKSHSGNRTRAAETLGISRRTLQRKIKELELE